MVDLGTLGGAESMGWLINQGGQVAGIAQHASGEWRAFSWTADGGMTDLGTFGGGGSDSAALNSEGEIVGSAQDASGQRRAFLWRMKTGSLLDLNEVTPGKPAGMMLERGLAIAGDGTLLADSNAGLVLLRPGPLSSHPPLVAPIAADDPVAVGTAVRVRANYTDADAGDSHTATWDWGDGSSLEAGIVEGSDGAGTVTGAHVYDAAGIYRVALTVTDDTGRAAQVARDVVVYDPSAGFVTGGGTIDSPMGAYRSDPTLSGRAAFAFVARYQRGAKVPTGVTRFMFNAARLSFRSDSYEWLVVGGARAQFKGTGTINGMGHYSFMLTAVDGDLLGQGQSDRFRIKIWHHDAALDRDVIVYDNQIDGNLEGTTQEGTAVERGSIVIHAR